MTLETLIALACLTEKEREAFLDKQLCGISFYAQACRDGVNDTTVRDAHDRACRKLLVAMLADRVAA